MQPQGTGLDPESTARFQQILSRLLELPNYTWDTEIAPFHSVRAPCTWTTPARLRTRLPVLVRVSGSRPGRACIASDRS